MVQLQLPLLPLGTQSPPSLPPPSPPPPLPDAVATRPPSSSWMFLSGLKTNSLPSVLPPRRMPTSFVPLPEVVKTGEPLSPPATMVSVECCTSVWQMSWMFDPDTFTRAQVCDTVPCVQPVVRPTFWIVPLKLVEVLSCSPMLKLPSMSRLPEFTPVVFAMTPRLDSVPLL
jgi:hypothetical protein